MRHCKRLNKYFSAFLTFDPSQKAVSSWGPLARFRCLRGVSSSNREGAPSKLPTWFHLKNTLRLKEVNRSKARGEKQTHVKKKKKKKLSFLSL